MRALLSAPLMGLRRLGEDLAIRGMVPMLIVSVAAAVFGTGYLWTSHVLPTKWVVVIQIGVALVSLAIASGRFERIFFVTMMTAIPINPDIFWHPTPPPPLGTEVLGISFIEILLIGLYAAWFFRIALERPSLRELWPIGTLPLLAMIGWAALSMVNAPRLDYALFLLAAFLKSLLWFFYVANHVRTPRDLRIVVTCLAVGLLLETAFCLAQHVAGQPLGLGFFGERLSAKQVELLASKVFRVGGTLGHPNSLGAYIAGVLPVMMAMCLAAVPKRLRMLAMAACAGGSVALVLSFSRSAWVAAALCFVLLVAWLLADRTRRNRVLPIALISVVICLALSAFAPLIKARWTEDDNGSTVSRFSQFRVTNQMIQAHPWLGVGLNHYTYAVHLYETYVVDNKRGMVYLMAGRVHNVLLMTAAESGIPILIWLSWFLLRVAWTGWCSIRRSRDELVRFALMGMLLGLFARILHDTFHTGNLALNPYLWVFTAILAASPRIVAAERAPSEAAV
jgi:O-antigen ligase